MYLSLACSSTLATALSSETWATSRPCTAPS
jgi:hypothetical protein